MDVLHIALALLSISIFLSFILGRYLAIYFAILQVRDL